MKRNHLLLLSLLALAPQSAWSGTGLAQLTSSGEIVHTSPFPADGEASYVLPALDSYAERHARMGESPAAWGVSRREVPPHDPFPFGGGPVDD